MGSFPIIWNLSYVKGPVRHLFGAEIEGRFLDVALNSFRKLSPNEAQISRQNIEAKAKLLEQRFLKEFKVTY